MRIDKYLKNSRLIKRRVVAQEMLTKGRVLLNDKVAKKSSDVKVGDVIILKYGNSEQVRHVCVKVVSLKEKVSKEEAMTLYEVMEV